MPAFADATLYDPTLPQRFAPLLREVAGFMALNRAARALDPGPERDAAVAELRGRHDVLLTAALEQLPPERPVGDRDAEAAFLSGAVRLERYQDTVLGEPPLVDTAGSRTLAGFSLDLAHVPPERFAAPLDAAFDPDPEQDVAIRGPLDTELAQLALRQRLMLALDDRFPLRPGADNRGAIDALFEAFYPGHPLPAGTVEVIRTTTGLYFCLPLESRPTEGPVAEFLDRLLDFHPSFVAHFPSFGSMTAERVPSGLIERLVGDTGLPASQVAAALPTMVVVLPLEKVDQYIVHDIWGHTWQSLLFRFEETYQRAGQHTRLPRLDQTFRCERRGLAPVEASLRQVIEQQVARVEAGLPVALEAYEAWLRAASAARLYDALAGLNAEVLADVVEYKYLALRPQDAALMPSSSFVKELPTKLDLTLLDLPEYYERALTGFRRFAERQRAEDALLRALGGAPGGPTAQVLDAFAARTGAWLDEVHGEDVWSEERAGELRVNTMARVALNYLGLHAQLNQLYAGMRERCGDVRFADLLVFSSAAFLERHWAREFWHLDELLTRFEELFNKFEAALTPNG